MHAQLVVVESIGCQSSFPVVTHKQQGNFWTGEPVFPPTRKSERSVARQALDSRSNRAGTLGVTPGATSRDESTHWSPVISSESVRVKGEKEVLQTQLVWKRLNLARPQCCGELTPEQLVVLLLSSHSSSDNTHWQPFELKLKCISINIGTLSKTDYNMFLHDFSFPHCDFLQ